MPNLVSNFRTDLIQNMVDFQKLYQLALRNVDMFKGDFVTTPCEQFVSLKRETLGQLTQPSLKDSTQNFTNNLVDWKERIVGNKDCKLDLKFTEAELQTIRRHYINSMDPATPGDIFSLGGQSYFMDRIFAKVQDEIGRGVYNGVRGSTTVTNGGTNLFDGIWTIILADIAGSQISGSTQSVYTAAAPTLTSANILTEMKKFRDKIIANTALYETYLQEGGTCFIAPETAIMIQDAIDALLSNADQVFIRDGNNFRFKGLEGILIKPVRWMLGSTNFFSTLPGNLHWLPSIDGQLPGLDVQHIYRDLVVLGDFKAGVNYADPRGLMMYRSYGVA